MTELGDLGERRIIAEFLKSRYGTNNARFGDDVAIAFVKDDKSIVVTMDPAPEPVAWSLGIGDYYEWGWLLSAINLSDLAASGSTPLNLLTSLTLPNNTTIEAFQRLLDGIDDCAETADCGVIGGNLKESPVPRIEAAAIGLVRGTPPLSRNGAVPGDVVVAFGSLGQFWACVLSEQRGLLLARELQEQLRSALTRPRPLCALGVALRESGLIHSCTDASDGIFGALLSLSVDQGLGTTIFPNDIEYSPEVIHVANLLNVDPFRLALGFGNLELVVTAPRDAVTEIRDLAEEHHVEFSPIGVITEHRGIFLQTESGPRPMNNFDNERFTRESQFTSGLEEFGRRLIELPLTLSM